MALKGSYYSYPVSSFGLYVEWTASQSVIGNYSDVTQKIYLSYYKLAVGSRSGSTSSINGTLVTYIAPAISDDTDGWKKKLLYTHKVRVSHAKNGTATNIPLSASWQFSGTYSNVKIGTITASTSINLNSIDRAGPGVSFEVKNVTASSVNITTKTKNTADSWDYKLDNDSNWKNMSTAVGTLATTTIQNLSPNTTYNIQVRARRQYNQVYDIAPKQSFKTLGNSLLNLVSPLTVDEASPVLKMNWTVYATYTHTLVIKDGTETVLTLTGLTCSTGTNNKTVTLTAEQRNIILGHMEGEQSFTATFELTTYSGKNKIGNTVSQQAIIQTTSGTSAPTFSGFTHKDSDQNGTVNITGNNQIYIKGYSSLQIELGTNSAKNGASISSYKVTVGSDSKPFKTTEINDGTINYGTIGVSGNVTLKVEVIDSRGYSTVITKTLTVIDYEDISITDYTIRRKNEVGETVQLAFSGDISPIMIGGEAQNGVVSAEFRYKPNGDDWSDWSNLTVAEPSTSLQFQVATSKLSDSKGNSKFDSNLQYTVEIKITDRLSSDTMTVILNKGTPLVAFRAKKVGVNTSEPEDALDVCGGNIRMNGYVIQGFVAELGNTEDLHDFTHNGIWTQAISAHAITYHHYPVEKAGYLEVFQNPQGYVLQRYTAYDCSGIYICYFDNNSWSAWKSINIS